MFALFAHYRLINSSTVVCYWMFLLTVVIPGLSVCLPATFHSIS